MFSSGVVSPVDGRLNYFSSAFSSPIPHSATSNASASASITPVLSSSSSSSSSSSDCSSSQPFLSPIHSAVDEILSPSASHRPSLNSASLLDCSELSSSLCFPNQITILSLLKFLRPRSLSPPVGRSATLISQLTHSHSAPVQLGHANSNHQPGILDLPSDIIDFYLPPFLDSLSLIHFSSTCSSLRPLANDETLWRSLCEKRFPWDCEQRRRRDLDRSMSLAATSSASASSASVSSSSSASPSPPSPVRLDVSKDVYKYFHHIHWEFLKSPHLMNHARTHEFRLKLCFFGPNKRKFIQFFANDKQKPKLQMELGMEFLNARFIIQKKIVKIRLFTAELPGPTDESQAAACIRSIDGLMISFKLSDRASFQAAVKFRSSQVEDELNNRNVQILLIGERNSRASTPAVSNEEIKDFIRSFNMEYIEIDYDSGVDIEESVYRLSSLCLQTLLPDFPVHQPQLFEAFAVTRSATALMQPDEPLGEAMEFQQLREQPTQLHLQQQQRIQNNGINNNNNNQNNNNSCNIQ